MPWQARQYSVPTKLDSIMAVSLPLMDIGGCSWAMSSVWVWWATPSSARLWPDRRTAQQAVRREENTIRLICSWENSLIVDFVNPDLQVTGVLEGWTARMKIAVRSGMDSNQIKNHEISGQGGDSWGLGADTSG
jgi:hypothetical protein